jgi:hypothetical protein
MYARLLAAGLAMFVGAGVASAWWVKGHASITEAAAARLPEGMPAFFRAAGKDLGHYAGDPDRWKNPAARHLRAAESPDHYIDLEDLEGNEPPADRFQAAALIVRLKHRPDRTGLLPYAIMEGYDRLSCAFYDLRENPKSTAIQAKCLVYAGNLAHFTTDASMPLHTTRDYDGKRVADGTILQRGIHAKIDAFPEKNGLTPEEIGQGLAPRPVEDVWVYVLKTIQDSHKQVPRCYELDLAGAFDKPTAESRKFILDRCRVGAQFTIDLWYNAWLRSATMPKHY